MSVGKLSSYFTKRRDAASFKDPEEGSDKRPTSSVRARLEKKLHVKQKTGFAFNFDLVEDEGLEKGDARGGSTERESFRFEFDPTETPGDVGTSVGGKQHRCGGDADPREDDDFVVHVVSGMSTAPRSAKKKGKRKAGGKKKKSAKGKGKGAGNPDRHPAENELNRERDESTGSPTKDAAIVVPSPALATNEGCQSDDVISLGMRNDSPEGVAPLQQQPETDAVGHAQPDAGRMEPSPVPVVARPPPGLTLESWKDPALTLEERRRRRFGRGVRNMAAIQRSRDARRGAGSEARTSDVPFDELQSTSLQAAMGKRGRDRSPSSEEERGSRNTSKSSKYKKKDKGKKSSKRATRSESRSRSPPARSRGKESGRSRRNDRSRSPSLDDEARKRAKEARREQKYQEKLALKKAQRRAAESTKDKADRKMKAKQDGTAAHFGYTNDINPFGDSNLTEQFVWGKKKEKEGTADQLVTKREQRDTQKKNVEEIEKVRKRRDDAEAEREEMERLKAEESRLREQQQYGDWQKKEEHFHLKQATQRSKIRLVEGRDRPIDRLAKNVLLFGEQDAGEEDVGIKYGGKGEVDVTGLEMELREPYKLFDGLTLEELEELQAEILQYQDLVGETGPNRDFWLSLGMVCDDKVSKAKELLGETEEGVATGGLHKTVIDDVTAKFENQTLEELSEQQTKIQDMLDSDKASVDSEFWEAVLKELHVFKAMAKLRNVHQTMLEAQLEKLEEMRDTMKSKNTGRGEGDEEEGDEEEGEDGKGPAAATVAADSSALALGMLANEQSKGMGEQEEGMDLADEVDMGGKTYWWHDKYRPRKPRYFNRVKTGYDWNKYNQTHYDHDNPPPKTVQGYKFNVFYPDLIDRQETPKYHLEKADHPGFAILRFHAGPPYEDIAFKIINREWEFGRKRGFRCVFERGVLSLYFNFKSLWYRK